MISVGLTGSIGMGKSTVAGMLRDLAVPVFDADAEVHRIQAPGGEALPAIEAAFPGVVGSDGLDRSALGTRVFADPQALARLEAIIHPLVTAARAAFVEANLDMPIVVFDIPLLFERGSSKLHAATIVVSAPLEKQRARVLARPGMTEEKFEQILARQMPDEEKRALADYVIDTGTSLEETRSRVAEVIACILAGEGR